MILGYAVFISLRSTFEPLRDMLNNVITENACHGSENVWKSRYIYKIKSAKIHVRTINLNFTAVQK
jgi:hypothetical protein